MSQGRFTAVEAMALMGTAGTRRGGPSPGLIVAASSEPQTAQILDMLMGPLVALLTQKAKTRGGEVTPDDITTALTSLRYPEHANALQSRLIASGHLEVLADGRLILSTSSPQ